MFTTGGVQRAAEDAGGAAAPRGVHPRHHRGPQDPHHHPVALPALRLQADPDRAAVRAPRERSWRGEKIAFEPEGLRLLARQAAGSVRDALSLLDQMIAYVGDAPITAELVAEVLGVADRRLLVGLCQAVLARDAAAALRPWPGGRPGRRSGAAGPRLPGLHPRRRGGRPGRRCRPIWSTPAPTRSPRPARAGRARRRAGLAGHPVRSLGPRGRRGRPSRRPRG